MFLSDDDMVECPYNKTHRMLRRRLQVHLHKCRLNYPDVELRKCPFNITHLIPEPEYVHHATNCPDRKLITQYKYDAPEVKEEEVPKHAPIECDEDWDDTDVNDYNPQKYLENAKVIIKPDGALVSERKKIIKKERKCLGDGDERYEDESETGSSIRQKSKSPFGYKRRESSERSHRSLYSRRSRSPSTSHYSKQRSRSPRNRFERGHSRSKSPNDNRTHQYNSLARRQSPDSLRSYSYTNYERTQSYNDHSDESNHSMPEAPPPPMISYPAPRSYSSRKYQPSASDY